MYSNNNSNNNNNNSNNSNNQLLDTRIVSNNKLIIVIIIIKVLWIPINLCKSNHLRVSNWILYLGILVLHSLLLSSLVVITLT